MSHKDPEQRRAYDRAYRATHRELYRTADRHWRAANRGSFNARTCAYKAAHPERVQFHSARERAKRYGVPCTLTIANVRALLEPMRCSVTGLGLVRGKGKPGPLSPSLDRIEPAQGYVPGNVRLTCTRFNVLRKTAPVSRDAEFRARVLAELGEVQA